MEQQQLLEQQQQRQRLEQLAPAIAVGHTAIYAEIRMAFEGDPEQTNIIRSTT